jgi:cbb3-type cytochrome oxidase subunit 3
VALIALALVAGVVPAFRAYRRRERENAARTLARDAAAGAAQ